MRPSTEDNFVVWMEITSQSEHFQGVLHGYGSYSDPSSLAVKPPLREERKLLLRILSPVRTEFRPYFVDLRRDSLFVFCASRFEDRLVLMSAESLSSQPTASSLRST